MEGLVCSVPFWNLFLTPIPLACGCRALARWSTNLTALSFGSHHRKGMSSVCVWPRGLGLALAGAEPAVHSGDLMRIHYSIYTSPIACITLHETAVARLGQDFGAQP